MADTNVVFRRVLISDPLHERVKSGIDSLLRSGRIIQVTPQNLIEFQALATRPVEANGLGLTASDASTQARLIESYFDLLPETPVI